MGEVGGGGEAAEGVVMSPRLMADDLVELAIVEDTLGAPLEVPGYLVAAALAADPEDLDEELSSVRGLS